IRMFLQQTPTDVGTTPPVGAFIEVAKAPIVGRTGVSAVLPLFVNLSVAIAAVMNLLSVGGWIDPGIFFVVGVGQSAQMQLERPGVGTNPGNEITFFPSCDASRRWRTSKNEFTVAVGHGKLRIALDANMGMLKGAVVCKDLPNDGIRRLPNWRADKDQIPDCSGQ